jgi:hypothetical protein
MWSKNVMEDARLQRTMPGIVVNPLKLSFAIGGVCGPAG